MKPKRASKRKRPGQSAGSRGSAVFAEPSPNMATDHPEWPEAFSDWWTRKCAAYGMDPIEGMARALGMKGEADGWRRRRQAELRHREQGANDIYGKPPKA